jgi:glutamyl/glutaminyl-tRNA synthetase
MANSANATAPNSVCRCFRWAGKGFQDTGFLPEATINFLALLGWHPGGEQEIFSLDALIDAFSIEHIGKSGARFDYEKAKWFNQKYIQHTDNATLAGMIAPLAAEKGYRTDAGYLEQVAALMKERVTFLPDFVEQGYYLFEPVREYDEETLQKRWNPTHLPIFEELIGMIRNFEPFEAHPLEEAVKQFIQEKGLKPGDMLPLLRLALAGTMKGPAVFDMAVALGREESIQRLQALAASR